MGLEDGVEGGVSGFFASFIAGPTGAPKGFEKSGAGLGGKALVAGGDAGAGPGVDTFELEENFELMLDIHEFRLPGCVPLWSLGFLETFELGDSLFSDVWRWER